MTLNWGASSRWSSSQYGLMRNSDEMIIGNMYPTLQLITKGQLDLYLNASLNWNHMKLWKIKLSPEKYYTLNHEGIENDFTAAKGSRITIMKATESRHNFETNIVYII